MRRECVTQRPCGLTIATALLVALGALAGCAKRADNAQTQAAATPPQAIQDATTTAGAPAGVTTFATPEEAVDALIAAGEKQDNAALAALLGPGVKICCPRAIRLQIAARGMLSSRATAPVTSWSRAVPMSWRC
jgi:hypothetical protein